MLKSVTMATFTPANIRDLQEHVISDPQRLGGEPVFVGTRVPVRTLFVYIRKGLGIDQFLDDFEGVDRQHVDAVLELAESDILQQFHRSA